MNKLEEPLSIAVKGVSWLVTLFFVLAEGYKQKWVSLVVLVCVFALLYYLRTQLNLSLEVCLVVSVLVTLVVTFETKSKSSVSEKFENPDNSESKEETTTTEEETNKDTNIPYNPENSPSEHSVEEKPKKETFANKKEEEEESFSTNIDMGRTFLEAYKNLTPDQIKSMTTDAKDLIETQKALVDTIKSLSPVVSDGRKLLETFKDFFGPTGSILPSK